jgi:hypothetical protein
VEEEDRDERQRQEPDTTSDQVSGVACRVTGAHVWEVLVSLLCGVTTRGVTTLWCHYPVVSLLCGVTTLLFRVYGFGFRHYSVVSLLCARRAQATCTQKVCTSVVSMRGWHVCGGEAGVCNQV